MSNVGVDVVPRLQGVHPQSVTHRLTYAPVPVSGVNTALAYTQELKSLQNKAWIVERFNLSDNILLTKRRRCKVWMLFTVGQLWEYGWAIGKACAVVMKV